MQNIQAPFRLQRSLLSVPATSEKFFAKAAASEADAVMLDLEDSVAPAQKAQGRTMIIQALQDVDWGTRTMIVRVNGLETPWAYRDLVEICEASPRLDVVMVPKVNGPEMVKAVDLWLGGIEQATGRKIPIGIEAQVETALGLTQVEATAQAGGRLEGFSFGPGDYAASINNRTQTIGGQDPNYVLYTGEEKTPHWNDVWHYPMARISAACHAYGIRPVDGPFVDFKEEAGFKASARRALALGYEGKWAIHPDQVPLANEVFTPSTSEVMWAEELLETMEKTHQSGAGAVGLEGEMIDMAHVRLAEKMTAKARQIQARANNSGA